ncbi:hypothetical protein OPT61_g6205 [Boeremia exigua]|uniref:Uncharacterized protein n=1 Tax=Boeremia exigua TaxID=749465 RepID=A0ACC2I7L4_9PLEO|nr:hypothetical protein OPT61_g6205 [Boeremia exigua]
MHEQRGAANTANLRRPSQGTRPLDVAVETAEVRGAGLRSMLGGPVENVARPAMLLSCAELRLPLVLPCLTQLQRAAGHTPCKRARRCGDWLHSREDDGRRAEQLAKLTIRPATSVSRRHPDRRESTIAPQDSPNLRKPGPKSFLALKADGMAGVRGADVNQGACHVRNVEQPASNGPLTQGAPGGRAMARDENSTAHEGYPEPCTT